MTSPRARNWRLNPRAFWTLSALLVLGVAGFAAAWAVQGARGRPALKKQAQQLAKDGRDDLAQSYLARYLQDAPRDAEALDLRAELLARSAKTPEDVLGAIHAGDAALRLLPEGPELRKARRRQVELILRVGPLVSPDERRYRTAELLSRHLIEGEGAGDPAALRLRAEVLERLAGEGEPERRKEAVALFEKARAARPGDVETASRLARLYRDKLDQADRARRVLDELLAAGDTPAVRVARHRYFLGEARDLIGRGQIRAAESARDRADAELDAALKAHPDDLELRLTAAEAAIQRNRPALAQGHLDRVAKKAGDDPRVRALQGLIRLNENRVDEAIEDWSRGLEAAHGGDANLTWRLAFALLQRGRVAEAEPLILQYRRLAGGDEATPLARYLEAIKALRQNRPADAVEELEKARLKGLSAELAAQLHLVAGQAFEALHDEPRALEEYARCLKDDPRIADARLGRARLLQDRRPDEAAAELRQGLEAAGDDPGLLIELARLEWRQQLRQPASQRKWTGLDQLLERARRVAPGSARLALVEADALAARGQAREAADLLNRAVRQDKRSPELWLALAERTAQLGRPGEALLVLERAADPGNVGDIAALRILRARLLTLQGRGREAREGLLRDEDRIRADQRPQLWKALGDLYAAQRDRDNARLAYGRWADALPQDPAPHLFLLELALSEPDAPGAEAEIDRQLKALSATGSRGLYGKIARAMTLLTTAGKPGAADAERLREAGRLIDEIASEAPQRRHAYLLRGRLEELRNRPEQAVAAYERALPLDGGETALPRLVALYAKLGREADLARLRRDYTSAVAGLDRFAAENYLRQGDKARAEQLARQVVEGDPESLDARVWQARLLNTLGKPDEAEAALRLLVERHADEPAPWLALLFFQVGRLNGTPPDKPAERERRRGEAAATVEQMRARVTRSDRPEFLQAQCWRVVGDRERADALYETSLKKWPEDNAVARGAADYYETTGRAERTSEILRDVLKRDPKQRWATRALALFASSRARDAASWRQALDILGSPSEADATPEDRLVRAIVLARSADEAQARSAAGLLEQLLADLPADLPAAGTARNVLARLYLKSGRAEDAAKLAAVEAADGSNPAAQGFLAEALLAAGRLDDAAKAIDRLAAIAPDDLATALLRARLFHAREDDDKAAALLEETFSAHRNDPPASAELVGREVVRLLVDWNRLPAADRVASAMAASWPKTRGVLAAVRAREGRQDEALDLFEAAVADAEPAALVEACRNALKLATAGPRDARRLARADAILAAALKRQPASSDLLALAGYLHHFQGRYAEEVECYRRALTGRAGDYAFLNNMAWALCEGLKRPDEALARINEAFEKTGKPLPQFLDTRGVIYTRLGRLDDALRDLEAAASARPTGVVLAHLARIYHLKGRRDDFRTTRDRALKAGLTPQALEPADRADLEPLLFGSGQ